MPLGELHHNECRNAKFWFHVFLANHLKLSQFGNNIWNLFGASIWDRTMKFIVCLYFIRRKKKSTTNESSELLDWRFRGKTSVCLETSFWSEKRRWERHWIFQRHSDDTRPPLCVDMYVSHGWLVYTGICESSHTAVSVLYLLYVW